MREKIIKRLDLIREEFEQRANCKVMFIEPSNGQHGVEIMTQIDAYHYAPKFFTSIKQIGQLDGKMTIIGFVAADEFDCLIER